jgi:hypothetical protein
MAFYAGELQFFHSLESLREPVSFARYFAKAKKSQWVIYAKRPFAGPQQVLDYVGRYTHRVAISNNRLLDIEGDQVQFKWKDYRHGDHIKTMNLSADEFIRRFLMHVCMSCQTAFIASAITASSGTDIATKKTGSVPPPTRHAEGRTRSRPAQARKGIPRAIRRTYWPFFAPVSALSPGPNGPHPHVPNSVAAPLG